MSDDEKTTTTEQAAPPKKDPTEPEWSPVPLQPIKEWLKANPDAAMESVFPTVYEEDRTAKIKDLATAQGLLYITHRRAAEQTVKELGFENYDYLDEQAQIRTESKALDPAALGAADGIASAAVGLRRPGAPGPEGVPMATPVRTPPANGGPPAAVPSTPVGDRFGPEPDPEQHRADLSGDSAHDFRRQQRQSEALTTFLADLGGLFRRFGEEQASRQDALERFQEGINRMVERVSSPMITVPPQPAPVVHVHVPDPSDRVIEISRDSSGRMKTMRETKKK